MQHTPFYGTILIVIVAALSLIAGLAVVLATSPESIRLAALQQATPHTTAAAVAQNATPVATETAVAEVTATLALSSTPQVTPSGGANTATVEVTLTATETATATGTAFPTLAPDAIALGRIATNNNSTARLRSAAGLEGRVVAAIQAGEYVQILGGTTTMDEIDWLPVRSNSGVNGWISADLVETLSTATPD
jgi:uncharacterized protein YgiM (DUF1202 family)